MTNLDRARAASWVQITHPDGRTEIVTFSRYLAMTIDGRADELRPRILWPREVA